MSKPQSRAELIQYCLRALGAPVIEVNVDDDQLDDRLDDALQFYQDYHSDGTVRHYRKWQLTSEDIAGRCIEIPEDLLFVTRIMPIGYLNNRNEFSLQIQMHLNDIYDLRFPGSVINYEMTKQYLGIIDMTFNNGLDQNVRFNRHLNKLYIDTNWDDKFKVGDWIVIEGYSTVEPEDYVDVYNDLFLKRYLTALIKRQWGVNLKKFQGMQLPGGVEFNGQTIYDEAVAEIEKIESEMASRYDFPPQFMVG